MQVIKYHIFKGENKVKKALSVIMGLVLLIAMAGCSGETASEPKASKKENDFPKKTINVIVAYEPGGGTDTGARILMPYVEKELGVTVNIVNKPGGGGWVGWGELANAKPDGYTIGYINTPNLMTGYLDPKMNRKQNLESFEPIANHVVDPGAIAIRKDEDRFTNIEELIEYAKNNELTATSTGVGSDDHYASLKLNDKFGTKFKAVHNKGAADSRAAVLGGHVDVLFANVGEVASLHNDGELKVIGVMNKEKSPFLPDVPTLAEKGFEVYSWSARGLAAPAGIDPEILEVLRAALEKGITNEEQTKKMGDMGLQVDYSDGEDYKKLLKEDEESVKSLGRLMGW